MLGLLDVVVILVYLAAVAFIGLRAARGGSDGNEEFLGARRIPWLLAGLSILATETSALTFVGAPRRSLNGDWSYLQLAVGSIIGRLLVARILIPAYYRAGVVTVYGYLGERFGPASQRASTALFVVGRCLGSGVRLFGAAIALWTVVQIPFPAAIALIAIVAATYTLLGGIRSVIYTDAIQGLLLIGGGLAAAGFLLADLDMSPLMAWEALGSVDGPSKTRIFDPVFDFSTANVWSGILFGVFLTLATHGADQDMVQRTLTCRDHRRGALSLVFSAVLLMPVVALFLAVGSLLWLKLGDAGAATLAAEIAERMGHPDPAKGYDVIFPWYVVHELPSGVRGLIVAGVLAAAMSSLDSAVAALSSTVASAISTKENAVATSRRLTVLFALVLAGVAMAVWTLDDGKGDGFGILVLGLEVLAWIFPPLLGVFLVGTLTRRGRDRWNVVAVFTGTGFLLLRRFYFTEWDLSWTWNPVIGCGISFLLAVLPAARKGS